MLLLLAGSGSALAGADILAAEPATLAPSHTQLEQPTLLSGLSLGIALFAALYAAYLWIRQRKRYYAYFLLYFGCIGLLDSILGSAGSSATWLVDYQRLVLIAICLASTVGAVLSQAFMRQYPTNPLALRVLGALVVANSLALLAAPLLAPQLLRVSGMVIAGTSAALTAWCVATQASRRQYAIGLFSLAWAVLAAGVTLYALHHYAVVPANRLTANSLLVGSSLQLMLLTLALLEQRHVQHRQQLKEHSSAINDEIHSSAQLQFSQQQLEQQNTQLRQMLRKADRIDDVTGSLTAAALHRELEREYQTALRYGNTISVVVVEISDLLRIQQDGGELAGNAYLAAIAGIVGETLRRPGDITGRITGNHLSIVLPYTDTAGALVVMQRVVQGVNDWQQTNGPTSDRIKLRAGLASNEKQLFRHADDLIESAMAQIRDIAD
jgi:diguanylate cyclase (GGDEF)-like protein